MASREASKGREAIISVRVSSSEEERIKEAAAKRGEKVSTFVREAALETARPARGATGTSWSSSPSTMVAGGTIVPRYFGTPEVSKPAQPHGTAGNIAPEAVAQAY